jgi:hypothetical protein
MFYKKIFYISVLLSCCIGYTQTVSEVFQKMGNLYSVAKPLQYKSSYALYKDSDSKKIEQSYKGIFYKNSLNEIYMKIGETEILNSKAVNLKISHPEKAVEISDPINNYFGNFDVKPLLNLCKIESFKDYKTYWEITLITKKYSNLPYSKIVIQIAKNYFLQKSIFYYNTAVNFSKDYRAPNAYYPRLEVINTNYNRNPVNSSFFNSNSYFILSRKKQYVMTARLGKYEVIDQRTSSNK